jgi:hypothetical protein
VTEENHAVACSSRVSQRIACGALSPHISGAGIRLEHTAGRSGRPKIMQRFATSNWAQRTPAGLPCGIPGMAEEIEGATQQAPQPERQFIDY